MLTANKYIKAGERTYEPTIGDIITEYRHYVHEQAVTTPSLRALGDFLVKKGPEYTSSSVWVVKDLSREKEKAGGVHLFDDALQLYRHLSADLPEDEGLQVIFMEGLSQSSVAVVGSCTTLDPVHFAPHLEAQAILKAERISFPVYSDSQLRLGQLTGLILRAKRPMTGKPMPIIGLTIKTDPVKCLSQLAYLSSKRKTIGVTLPKSFKLVQTSGPIRTVLHQQAI